MIFSLDVFAALPMDIRLPAPVRVLIRRAATYARRRLPAMRERLKSKCMF